MKQPESTPRAVIERVQQSRREIGRAISNTGNDRLQELWRNWEARLCQIAEEATKRPQVAISLVGSTGAGKSTLLNALLDARLLPVSNMRACTAAISEVTYTEGGHYKAEIEFISRESWQREIRLLLDDIDDASGRSNLASENEGDTTAALDIPRVARDKLWTVYRPSEDAAPANFDPRHLEEPPEITRALDAGVEVVQCEDLEEFRKRIAVYLDSRHRYWPIVKLVKIHGPFEALSSGAKLIDLPGLNDPNEAREEVTKTHLKTCRFVWIVFNIKRVLTRDTINLMVSDDFLRQIVMDGRAGALTLVGTASDDVDSETGREEFNLDEDASEAAVVLARNTAVRQEVSRQLEELSSRLAKMAGENEERVKALAETFKRSKIFTVSAREYLRLTGLAKTRAAGLEGVDQTELPPLRSHMAEICSSYGVEAQANAHHRQIDLLLSETKRELYSRQVLLDQQTEIGQAQRKEIETAATAARTFLGTRLEDLRERFDQDLETGQDLLRERLRRAVDRAHGELDQVVSRWSRMHWATIRAVARRGGTYVGSTGRHDFPADLTKPILDTITFAWSDFFGDRLGQTLEKWTQRLLLLADDHRRRLLDSIGPLAASNPRLRQDLKDILETTEKVLAELLGQTKTDMEQKIETVRRTLYECIPDQVRANMRAAFEQAAQESGAGMKARIVNILARYAMAVSGVMFADAEREILQGVRGLNDWLSRKYFEMADTVNRHAGIAAENLGLGDDQMSAAAIEKERKALQSIAEVASSLMAEAMK